MNINFNFGEHFYDTNTSSLFYDIFIIFLGAFLGFLAALWINRLIEKKSEKKAQKDQELEFSSRLKYFSQLLDSVIKNYPSQASEYQKLAGKIKEKSLENALPNMHATFDLTRLKNLDSNNLRDAYFHFFDKDEDSIMNYRKIFSNVDYLLLYFDHLAQQNEKHRTFTHKDQLVVRDCIEEISNRIGLREKNIQIKFPDNYESLNEYKYLNKFSHLYTNITKTSTEFNVLFESYLIPLHDSILYEIQDTSFADIVFPIIKKALNRLRNIRFNSLEFAKDMEKVESIIQTPIQFLNETNSRLKEKNEP